MMTNYVPKGGWDDYARENPEAPLSRGGAESYLDHLINGHNNRAGDIAQFEKDLVKWKARSWLGRFVFPRPRCP